MLCMYPPHPHSVDDEFQGKNMFRFHHILALLFDHDNKHVKGQGLVDTSRPTTRKRQRESDQG